jgi:SAM-dependent methyltransferase
MAKHSTDYTASWQAGQRHRSLSSARRVVPILIEHLKPDSVIDVGCGVGTWLSVFSDLGIATVLGLDGDYVDRSTLLIDQDRFVATDLRNAFATAQRFDLAICLEVAEHLPQASGAGLVDRLVGSAPDVLFSAAIPGQGGTEHVNEQWQDYWRALFARSGYSPVDLVRPRVWGLPDVAPWYQQNTILYCSTASLEARPDLRRVADAISLNLVHPDFYEQARNRGALYLSKTLRMLPGLLASAVRRRFSTSF